MALDCIKSKVLLFENEIRREGRRAENGFGESQREKVVEERESDFVKVFSHRLLELNRNNRSSVNFRGSLKQQLGILQCEQEVRFWELSYMQSDCDLLQEVQSSAYVVSRGIFVLVQLRRVTLIHQFMTYCNLWSAYAPSHKRFIWESVRDLLISRKRFTVDIAAHFIFLAQVNGPVSKGRGGTWTKEENKKFERALAVYGDKTPNRWLHVTAMVPGKSIWDVIRHYEELEEDVNSIEAGLVPIPSYLGTAAFDLDWGDDGTFDGASRKKSVGMARNHEHERKKGVPWTEDEHRRFLLGLKKHGRGDWRNISRNFVISKTPTQVASHAQKYFLRQVSTAKDRKRPSIHDITTSTLTDTAGSGNNESHPSPKQATATQLQRNYGVASRMLLDWCLPDDETKMMFNNATRNDVERLSPLKLQKYAHNHANHLVYLNNKVLG
ncbi:Transcription factor DIVARICATA-like protein [Drosera capensis]